MSALKQYIRTFFGVNEEDVELISSFFYPESLAKGDFYQKAGKSCDKLSFIKTGFIRIFAETAEKEVTQWISVKGYFVTDLSGFIFDTPARFNMQALTDCELFTINKSEYKKLGEVIPEWNKLEKLFIARCFATLEDRVFSHLSMSAEERFQLLFKQQPDLFNQVPLQYLASMMGMTPETLSRLRKKVL